MRKPIAALGGTLLLVGAILVGCAPATSGGGDDPEQASGDLTGLRIAFAMPTSAGQLFVNQANRFKEQAEQLGATVELYDNNGDAVTMLSNADLMIGSQPDYIVEYPSVADATERVGQKFDDAGIPCIAMNIPVPGCHFLNLDQVYQAQIGAQAMADIMKTRGWDASNTTVVIGQASSFGPDYNIALWAFYEAISGLVPGMTPVDRADLDSTVTTINGVEGLQIDAGVAPDQAFAATSAALQSIPSDRNVVVYTSSDDATRGVVRALDNEGRLDAAMVSGYGGDLDSLNAIREKGAWVTDQVSFFEHWGEFALAMVAALRDGAELPDLTSPPMTVITADNVDEFYSPGTADLILMPELPENSQYLIETGVLQEFGNVTGATK